MREGHCPRQGLLCHPHQGQSGEEDDLSGRGAGQERVPRCQQEDPRQEVDRRTRPQVVIYSAVLFTLTRIFLLQSLNILDQQCFYQKFFSVVLLLFKIFMRYL